MSHSGPIRHESDAEIWNRFSKFAPADLKALIDTLNEEIAEIDASLTPLIQLRNEKGSEALSESHRKYLEEQSHTLWLNYRRRDVLKRMLRHVLNTGRPLDERSAPPPGAEGAEPPELSPEAQWVLDRLPEAFTFDVFMATAAIHEVPPREAPALLRRFLSKGFVEQIDAGRHFRKVDA